MGFVFIMLPAFRREAILGHGWFASRGASTIVQVSQVKSCLLDCQHELFEVWNIEPFSAFDKVQRSVHRLLDGSPDEL